MGRAAGSDDEQQAAEREPLPIQVESVGFRDQTALALERLDDAALAVEALIDKLHGKDPLASDIPTLRGIVKRLHAEQDELMRSYHKYAAIAADARGYFARRSADEASRRDHYRD